MAAKKPASLFVLEESHRRKIKEWAITLGVTQSEVMRRLIDEVTLKPVMRFVQEDPGVKESVD